MTAAPSRLQAGPDRPGDVQDRHPRRRVRAVAAGAAVAAAAAAITALAVSSRGSANNGAAVAGNADPTGLATVTRRPLAATTDVDATLGYAGSYTVLSHASGTITALPAAGQVIRQGQVLFEADDTPVFLLYGQVPAYRDLAQGMSGPDVQQLNADLVALGYATSADLDPSSDYFGSATASALKQLQQHLGLRPTGTLPLGQAVFLPAAIRVTTVRATLGGSAGGPVLQASSTTRVVTIALDAAQQSDVSVGDQVSITLPDGATTPGRVSSVGTVATSSASSPTITVLVRPTDPAATGRLDQAPVEVAITTASVKSALVVPVDALLAQPGGGYAVEETASGGTRHLVPVSLGLFDDSDGLVQVTGSGLAAGQHVVVPAT